MIWKNGVPCYCNKLSQLRRRYPVSAYPLIVDIIPGIITLNHDRLPCNTQCHQRPAQTTESTWILLYEKSTNATPRANTTPIWHFL